LTVAGRPETNACAVIDDAEGKSYEQIMELTGPAARR
jgi:hypothetical protein